MDAPSVRASAVADANVAQALISNDRDPIDHLGRANVRVERAARLRLAYISGSVDRSTSGPSPATARATCASPLALPPPTAIAAGSSTLVSLGINPFRLNE